MTDTCVRCRKPIDLRQPHVSVVQQTEVEDAHHNIQVLDGKVLIQRHLDCPAVPTQGDQP